MTTLPYVLDLQAAGFIARSPEIKGIPLWRNAGIRAVDLLVEEFMTAVAGHGRPAVWQHGFLADAKAADRVFGSYDNVYNVLDLPGHPDGQFRSDNIVTTVARLRREGRRGPVVSVGTVIRDAPGKTPPLFRDRSIWPVVELNRIVAPADASALLASYAAACERFLAAIGIPSLTVQTPVLSDYGKLTYLVVAVLPNKRPTVLATVYVLSDKLRTALGSDGDVLDVGFTGKVLATAAMLHADARGLALPSTVAPIQVGITAAAADDVTEWVARLRAGGLRCDLAIAGRPARRISAERTWHRRGVPLVIGVGPGRGSVSAGTRLPLRRDARRELPEPDEVRALLAQSDARLFARARRVFDAGMAQGAHLRSMCGDCARGEGLAVFGVLVPKAAVTCESCGSTAGERLFISDEGRFY
ncbi:hypothetical protein [Catenulispora pinisilvae]|uniref:hypothetical protein n=1 Tax=Catenulispora pinisilvae TaxID=2705253 RepID=UPI001891F5B6|nr:hypothetical protein [Catenulispora pinisilvae]